jgi:hypothetical protein
MIILTLSLIFLAFCVGLLMGGRAEARYWADHAEDGGAVHHKGTFYIVTKEGSKGLGGP